jgi:hypothetical protein
MRPAIVGLFGLASFFVSPASAQIYTDEVQVNNGLQGWVGIGTDNPSGILQLNSSFFQQYITGDNAAIRGKDDTWLFGYGGQTGNEDISIGTHDNTGSRTLTLAAGGTSRLKILANGNVGIGSNTPSAKLELISSVERETFRIFKAGNFSNYLSIWQGVGGAAVDPIGPGLLYLGYDQSTNVIVGNAGGNLGIGTNYRASLPQRKCSKTA